MNNLIYVKECQLNQPVTHVATKCIDKFIELPMIDASDGSLNQTTSGRRVETTYGVSE